MNRFLQALSNLFRIEDLRKRVLFTLALLAVYRLGAHIPTPGINKDVLELYFQQAQGSALGIFDLFSGGNLRRLTIFALGIMPYITSSIILQLMTVVFPYLERLQKEGELGRRKITQYTRYLTIVLSVIQSFTIATALQAQSLGGQSLVYTPGPSFILMTILTLTTGSAFIMWLGEQISERGIGNGMSLIIFTGIVVGLPRAVADLYEKAATRAWGPFTPIALIFLVALMIALLFGGRYQFITDAVRAISFGEPLYNLVYVLMIILFAFFYIGIVFNPTELADNMRKNGGFIPGIRPGRTTSEHVSKILKRLTFIGAIYLCLVCLLPEWLITGIHLDHLGWGIGSWFDRHFPTWFLKGLGVQFYFGGTSLLIVVGVAMDTVQQLEAQLVMRNYEGFARKGRLRGRR